ncbi:bacterial transcriptional activator domain-containing protein, partial [Armatimonas sp.]|uniref:AfsR/SARP family transcriptional regulator n=1 Tax=Armatimonas sp. TaxID=1872638 RepID=UPI00286B97EF
MIFPDAEPTSLDQAVGALRKQLGEQRNLLEVRMGKLRLNLKDTDCDLTLFDRLIKQRSSESALCQAIALYGGPLLPQGEKESTSIELHQWLHKERSRRETLFRDGVERALQLAREDNRPEDTLLLLRRYAQEFPKSERIWTLYVRAAHECGDRLEGISAYEQYRAA